MGEYLVTIVFELDKPSNIPATEELNGIVREAIRKHLKDTGTLVKDGNQPRIMGARVYGTNYRLPVEIH